VFFPSTSRKEDQEYLALAQNTMISQNTVDILEQQQEEQGMYSNLSSEHLFMLTDCLLRVHNYTKQYNYAVLQNIPQRSYS